MRKWSGMDRPRRPNNTSGNGTVIIRPYVDSFEKSCLDEHEAKMKISSLFFMLTILLSACQTLSPKVVANGEAKTAVSFIDLESFDADLALALRSSPDPITVDFLEKPSPNDTPERLQKWVSQVRENGGKVKVEMPKNEFTPKNPFALFGMIGSIWSGVSAISKMTDEQKYKLTNGRDAIIRLERSPNKELVIGQIVFVKN